MEALKATGSASGYADADVSVFPKAAYDKDMTYFGTKLITTASSTTRRRRAATSGSTSWIPRSGQGGAAEPLYSGAAAINMAASAPTRPRPRLLRDSSPRTGGGGAQQRTVLKQVAGGQKMYGRAGGVHALNAKSGARRWIFVFPKEGVSAITEPIAILKTAKHPEAAQALSTSSSREQARNSPRSKASCPCAPT